MRETVQEFAAALVNAVVIEESIADELNALAQDAFRTGDIEFGASFRTLARLHRAAAIQHRTRLAGLIERCSDIYCLDPGDGLSAE